MVSIIIPVYNQEKYICDCLDSVCAQTYRDIEVITVDDGSTDKSADLIAAYAEKDGRIRYVLQPNQGVSAARNTGLREAAGDFILFVDADDRIHSELTEKAVHRMEETGADLVCFGAEMWMDNGEHEVLDLYQPTQLLRGMELPDQTARAEAAMEWLLTQKIMFACWNKLYRRSVICSGQVSFPEKVKIGEDIGFQLDYLLHTGRISAMKEPLYYYYLHSGSAMTSFGFEKLNLDDFSRFLERSRRKYAAEGITAGQFCPLYVRAMENQLLKVSSSEQLYASVREIEQKGDFRMNFVRSMVRPWIFIHEYGKREGLRKWMQYGQCLWYTFV